MPQISPIIWMVPILFLFILIATTNANISPTNEYENNVTQKNNITSSISWNW